MKILFSNENPNEMDRFLCFLPNYRCQFLCREKAAIVFRNKVIKINQIQIRWKTEKLPYQLINVREQIIQCGFGDDEHNE